jgi:hypothetical protein
MKRLFSLLVVLSLLSTLPFTVRANDWTEVINDGKDAICSADFKSIAVSDSGDSWIIRLESWGDWDLIACDGMSLMFIYINLSGTRSKDESDYMITFMSFGDFIMGFSTDLKGDRKLSTSCSLKTNEKIGTITIKKKDLQAKNASFSLLGVIRSERGVIDAAPNNQQMALYKSNKPQPKAKLNISKDSFHFGLIQRDATPTASFDVINEGEGSLNISITSPSSVEIYPRRVNLGDYETAVITLTINPKNLPGKVYEETIKISSNAGEATVKVTFEVYPIPELQLDLNVLDFGIIMRNESKNLKLIVSNKNKGPITGSIKTKDPWLSINKTYFNATSEPILVSLNMRRVSSGKNEGLLSIETNGGNAEIKVFAEVVDPISSSRYHIDFGIIDEDSPPPYDEVLELTNHTDKNSAISITCSEEWIKISSQDLNLLPKASEKIMVNLNLKKMINKNQIYTGEIQVNSKNNITKITVSANLTQKAPELVWLSDEIDQKSINTTLFVGQSLDMPIVLKNAGSGECKVSSSLVDQKKHFRLFSPSFTLKRNETNTINVRFSAEGKAPGEYKALLNIESNGGKLDIPIVVTVLKKELLIIKLYIGDYTAFINDKAIKLDAPPYISQGSTMVPLRFIGEAFNAKVEWLNHGKGRIIVKLSGKTIQLDIGEKIAYIDGVKFTLNASPEIKNARTFVPVRFISEGFGAKIDWNPALQQVMISYESM